MFGILKAKRGEKKEQKSTSKIIDFEQKRREKRRFRFFKSYQLFGKPHEFTDWIDWQQRKKGRTDSDRKRANSKKEV